jgi:hypothetical protein
MTLSAFRRESTAVSLVSRPAVTPARYLEHEPDLVGGRRCQEDVDATELGIGERRRGLADGIRHQEADAEDDVELRVGELRDVAVVVGHVLG